jgi:GTP 3',8-cyclase
MPDQHRMQPEEIFSIAKIFTDLGVDKIRLTGGEPLLRKDVSEIIESLATLPVKLHLTTNGYYTDQFIDLFNKTGLRSINVSIDTLNPLKFKQITQRDFFKKTMQNIRQMIDLGMQPKINVVLIKGFNDDEIPSFIDWSAKENIHVRFIEFMPFQGNEWDSSKTILAEEILKKAGQHHAFTKLEDHPNDTAKKFKVIDGNGTFAIITTLSQPFCADCNRIRLTADGKLRNCLFANSETDLLTPLRQGRDIVPLIHETFKTKKERLGGNPYFFETNALQEYEKNRTMKNIGG